MSQLRVDNEKLRTFAKVHQLYKCMPQFSVSEPTKVQQVMGPHHAVGALQLVCTTIATVGSVNVP